LGKKAKGYWIDEKGEYHSSKCMIPIFIGHNDVVPQGRVHDSPSGCSSVGIVSCGNLGIDDEGEKTTNPAKSTIPGAPVINDFQKLNGNDVEKYVKNTVEAAKEHAEILCKKGCCKWITIVLHVLSDLKFTDEKAGYEDRIPIDCSKYK
jgi:hypothetical protein